MRVAQRVQQGFTAPDKINEVSLDHQRVEFVDKDQPKVPIEEDPFRIKMAKARWFTLSGYNPNPEGKNESPPKS